MQGIYSAVMAYSCWQSFYLRNLSETFDVKQILCQINLKQLYMYKDRETVDLEYARKCLMQGVEREWDKSVQTNTKLCIGIEH